MKVSTKGRYALRALTHLAKSYREDTNRPVSIKEISKKEKISNRYLENIFVKLRKKGIVESLKGEKGGFKLAKSPKKLTVYRILEAVENDMPPAKCVIDVKVCARSSECALRGMWVKLHKNVKDFLSQTTLNEVMEMHIGGKGKNG